MNNLNYRKQLTADLMLLTLTFGWGISYLLSDLALSEMGVFTLNAYRFLGAFLVAVILSWKKVKTINKSTFKYSILVGVALVFVYIGATFGLKYTTISNAGFLCAMTVLFTPLFSRIFLKKKQESKVIVAVTVSIIGIALLTLKEDFSLNMANLKGDLLCLMCGFFYAIDLLITEKAVAEEEVDAYNLGVFQLGVTGVLNFILALILEVPVLPQTSNVWGAVLFLMIFCTGIAFIVQPIAQQYTTAAHTGVIFTLEPVFNVIAAYFFLNEVLTTRAYIGGALMVVSILIMEVEITRKPKTDGGQISA